MIFGNQIKQDIYSILDHGKLEYTNVDIHFIESDQIYATFEDYKSNHTPGNAGMPNAVKRESRDNLILYY